MPNISGTEERSFSGAVKLLGDVVTLLRDALIFVLALLLIVFPQTFNDILVRAGFEEGSVVGFKWKSSFAQARSNLVQVTEENGRLKKHNDDFHLLLDQAQKAVPDGELKNQIRLALQSDEAVASRSAEVETEARKTIDQTAPLEAKLPSDLRPTWAVIFGSDSSLEGAQDEIRKAASAAGIQNARIFHYKNVYRSVVVSGDLSQATQERDMLRATRRPDAYISNLNNWCPEQTEKPGYIECSQRGS